MLSHINRNKGIKFVFILIVAAISIFCYFSLDRKENPKVLLICLDGASWNVMQPMIDNGQLPNIKQLMGRGSFGKLNTFPPLLSEVIWTSIATGKSPKLHGIGDRFMKDPQTQEFIYVTSNFRKSKTAWDILSVGSKKIGVINYPVTWPLTKINGVMISARTTEIDFIKYSDNDMSYPSFANLCSQPEFDTFKNIGPSFFADIEKDKFPEFWWQVENKDKFMFNFSKHLLKKYDFDFFCLYIQGIDIVSHRFWHYLFPKDTYSSTDDRDKYKKAIMNYYMWSDAAIGELLKLCDKDTTVIIISDHGFEAMGNDDYFFTKVDYLLEISGIKEINISGRTAILKNEPYNKTSLNKNIKITGNISPEEFVEARKKAKDTLKVIKVKENGEDLFADFQDTSDGFVIRLKRINPNSHIFVQGKEYNLSDFLTKSYSTGTHSNSASIIVSGKGILRNHLLQKATIYDITPTVLYYLGLPVSRDMTGSVLTEAFKENYLKHHPITYIDTHEDIGIQKQQKVIRRPFQEEEKIKERMRSLGYIN